jgi:hypothetical protein
MLKSLYLQNLDGSMQNPAVGKESYRKTVLSSLPRLHNLDGERCETRGCEDAGVL